MLLRLPRQDVGVRPCRLARDSPEMKKERELTRAKAMKNVQARSHSKGIPQWTKWEYEHQAVRSAMGPIDAPAPAHEQTCSELEASSGEVELSWDVSYCRRERDLLTLCCKHADLQGQLTETSLTFLDIGEMASHARTMPARLIPPLVTGHKIYWIEGQRHLLGEELLFAMGFPSDIQTRGLSQRDLTRIAGNSMSVDFLCVLNVLLLLFVDFDLC